MASATYALSVCSSSSPSCFKVKTLQYSLSSRFSQLGMCHFTPWNGLRYAGISVSAKPQKLGRREKCRGKVVYASLFGVGAPEALVIGAVALMVFGPKGLAEVARNLGKTLREFQPTIKELQEVSKEFKNALEREISLDDVSAERNTNEPSRSDVTSTQSVSSLNDAQITSTADTNGAPLKNTNSSDQHTNVTEEQLDAATQEDATSLPPESQIEIESQPQDDALPVNGHSSEDNLKITEEHVQVATSAEQDVASPQESLTEVESQPQGVSQEAVVAEPVVQKPESET